MSDIEVVISGCGWVTPYAWGSIRDVLDALSSRQPENRHSPAFVPIPDHVGSDCEDLSKEIKNDRGALITAVALSHALRSAAWSANNYSSERVGLVLGNALAGQSGMIQFANEVRDQTARFVSPIHFPQTVGNFISGALARAWSIRGPNSTVACGNASGLEAVAEGYRILQTGRADAVFAGGTELILPEIAESLAQSEGSVSDGACLFVLERGEQLMKRGGKAIATVVGYDTLDPGQLEARVRGLDESLITGTKSFGDRTILIHRWTEQCLGAWGASCMAAGIGASQGCVVPTSGADGTLRTLVDATGGDQEKNGGQGTPVLAFADGDDGVFRTVELMAHSTGPA